MMVMMMTVVVLVVIRKDDESLMIFLTRFADEIPTMRRAANIHSHLVDNGLDNDEHKW